MAKTSQRQKFDKFEGVKEIHKLLWRPQSTPPSCGTRHGVNVYVLILIVSV